MFDVRGLMFEVAHRAKGVDKQFKKVAWLQAGTRNEVTDKIKIKLTKFEFIKRYLKKRRAL